MNKNTFILIILICIFRTSYCLEFPSNPCPSIFSYIFNGRDWLGTITVPAPPASANILDISANFSIEGFITKYGPIKLDEYDKAIDKIKNGQPLTFVITLPKSRYLPTVTLITYNGQIWCSGPEVSAPTRSAFWLQYAFNWTGVIPLNPQIYYTVSPEIVTYQTPPYQVIFPSHTVAPPIYTNTPKVTTTTTTEKPVPVPPKFSNYQECGTIRKKRSLDEDDNAKRIINGSYIPINSHPWLVALYDVGQRNEFFCAGNLISNKHVLTAAHCTVVKKHSNIQVRLGVHNTNNLLDPGTVYRMAKKIVAHPDYQAGNAHADMSFILMDNEVIFTPAIMPICLWEYDTDFRAIIGYLGTIMGWGKDEHGEASPLPMKTDVTISTKQKCKEIDLLKNFVTDQTFCAGTKGQGPCMGDSGGGLFLTFYNKWYLRGIISTSIADQNTQICDTNTYSVYVDTAKYMDWIVNNMQHN